MAQIARGLRPGDAMGNMGLTTPRVILTSELQLHFKKADVRGEVIDRLSAWLEDGSMLGLTLDMFGDLLGLQAQAQPFFSTFDTDRNQKVDAFEVLTAFAILADGTIDEKVEAIFPMFDFAFNGRLNFDEINILVHSVYRGLRKVCGTKVIDDNDIIEVCRRLFDAHNLPYDKDITKEQLRRWLRNDVEACSFFDVFHNALAIPQTEAKLAEKEKIQSAVFSQLCAHLSVVAVPAQELLKSQEFRQSLDSPSDEALQKFTESMSVGGAAIGPEVFAKAVRAWNVFSVVDASNAGELEEKELHNLVYFQHREPPAPKVLEEWRGRLGLNPQGRIARPSWIEACLRS